MSPARPPRRPPSVRLPPLVLAPRAADAHKASVGRLLVVGGSRGMAGAPALAALGALRAGAGLVRVAVPRGIQPVVAGFHPEATTLGLPEDDAGSLHATALPLLLEEARGWDGVVAGPGAGRDPAALEVLRALSLALDRSLVLDADALFAWNGRVEGLRRRAAPTVLTPHEGEAARLLGTTSEQVRRDRPGTVALLAALTGAVIVLKGPSTLVGDGKRLHANATGGPVLASGGTGDVLAGVLGALLVGSGLDAFDAARAAVHVHGLAADRLAAAVPRGLDRGLLASDVAEEVPRALATLVKRPRPPRKRGR